MISTSELHGLFSLHAENRSVVSLYLELSDSQSCGKDFKALLQKRSEREPALKALPQDVEKLTRFVGSEFIPLRYRGLAVFSCAAMGFWLACPLPETVKSTIRLGDRPYIAPLVNILEQYRRYGVALIDGQRAKFFEAYLGEIAECAEKIEEIFPEKPPLAGRERHLRDIANHLMGLSRRRGFNRIVLAVPHDLESAAINHMHSFIQNKLIIDSQMTPDTPTPTVLQNIMTGEMQSRKVRESVLVHRLFDAVKMGGMGVVGLFETLGAVERGQVRMLLVRDGLAKMGRACLACGHLMLSGKRCHACYQLTEPVFNLIAEIVELALDQQCEVIRIFHDARLDHVGGIGAELKFSVSDHQGAALALKT